MKSFIKSDFKIMMGVVLLMNRHTGGLIHEDGLLLHTSTEKRMTVGCVAGGWLFCRAA